MVQTLAQDRVVDVIAALNLTHVGNRAAKENQWDEKTKSLAIHDYRRFLTLIRDCPGHTVIPSTLIDEVWHAHVLFTREYHADCDNVFGFYLHHHPYYGEKRANEEACAHDILNTVNLFRENGGVPQSYVQEYLDSTGSFIRPELDRLICGGAHCK